MNERRNDTRELILTAAYQLFFRQGFARASVDAIAFRAGVTKRTVYYHFESKDEIVAAAMEVQNLHLLTQFRAWISPSSDTAAKTIADLFCQLESWSRQTDWLGSGFSRISAELADLSGHPARRAARLHKEAVEAWLAERFAATGKDDAVRLAREIMLLIEGSMSLTLIHGDTAYIAAAKSAGLRLVSDG